MPARCGGAGLRHGRRWAGVAQAPGEETAGKFRERVAGRRRLRCYGDLTVFWCLSHCDDGGRGGERDGWSGVDGGRSARVAARWSVRNALFIVLRKALPARHAARRDRVRCGGSREHGHHGVRGIRGGARMCAARTRTSTMCIGAPHCGQTKVGVLVPVEL